jgi:hypothetical protein
MMKGDGKKEVEVEEDASVDRGNVRRQKMRPNNVELLAPCQYRAQADGLRGGRRGE